MYHVFLPETKLAFAAMDRTVSSDVLDQFDAANTWAQETHSCVPLRNKYIG